MLVTASAKEFAISWSLSCYKNSISILNDYKGDESVLPCRIHGPARLLEGAYLLRSQDPGRLVVEMLAR